MDSTASSPATPCCLNDRPPPPAPGKIKAGVKELLPILVALPLGALLAFYIGPLFGKLLMPYEGPKLLRGLVILCVPLLWLLAVMLHELGHLIGGWLIGGRFILYCVGPFLWQRSPEGIRFRLNRSLNLFGGLAACMPVDPALVTPRRFSVMIMGGPLASLLQTLLFVALAWGMRSSSFFSKSHWPLFHDLLCFGALFSLLIFVVTIMPATVQGMKSDGLRAVSLLRGGPRTDQEAAMLALNALSLSGLRSAAFPEDLVRRSLALNDGSLFDLYAHFLAFYHKADLGRWPEAQAHLDHALSNEAALAPHMRTALRCEYAWLLATQGPFTASARAWLDSAGEFKLDPATRLRAEAAVLLGEGRLEEASGCVAEARSALHRHSMGEKPSLFALEALERIQSQITSRRA